MLPKNLKLTLVWFFLGGFVMLAAIWMAVLTAAREKQAANILPPPAKTRHALRPAVEPFHDLAVDYVERCERGMGDREIVGILDDFENAGLAETSTANLSGDQMVANRAAQIRWYHACLVDGFRLTPDQSITTARNLAGQFRTFRDWMIADRKSFPAGMKQQPPRDHPLPRIIGWLSADPFSSQEIATIYSPSNLCNLKADQLQITDLEESARKELGSWADGRIFPFLARQEFSAEDSEKGILADVRKMHPAQLKLSLLNNPSLAVRLRAALSAAGDSKPGD